MTIKADCFGYKQRQCTILTEMLCKTTGKCPFYKTQKQFDEDREKYRPKI